MIALVCGMGNDPHDAQSPPPPSSSTSPPTSPSSSTTAAQVEEVDGNVVSKEGAPLAALPPTSTPASVVGGGTSPSVGVAMLEQELMTPMTRLKEALSAKDAFKRHYLVS